MRQGRPSLLTRLKTFYLHRHYRYVRGASDHPVRHAERLLRAAADGTGGAGILCDVGAGSEPSLATRGWKGRRIAVDLRPSAGLDAVADAEHLPLRDGSVEAVLLMEVMEHVPTPLGVLREAARVLRRGGHACVTAPQYCIVHNYPGDFYRYTNEGLAYLCREAGLRVLDVRPTGGPFLVLFHVIEWNLPLRARLVFVGLTYRLFDWLDGRVCDHGRRAGVHDALGWAVLAVKA